MKRSASGLTLVELLVTVAILIIVLAIAVPSFRELMLNNRQVTRVNELLGSLNLARAEAVKRGVRTAVCKGSAASGCETTTAGCCDTTLSNGWEQGWFIFVDTNEDSNLTSATGDALLQRHEALAGGMTLRGNANVRNRVIFNQRGSSGSPGTLRLCDPRGAAEARGIVVLGTGRARVATDTDTPPDGIVDDGGGNNLSCP